MEEEDVIVEQDTAVRRRVGDRLREAREAKGLDIDQVSAQTRIPKRHLQTIEAGNFASLPSRTYAIGFTRTYARTLGLDEHELLDQVREELAEGDPNAVERPAKFEPGDPSHVPGRGLVLFAILAILLLVGGVYAFYSTYFSPGIGPAPLQEPKEQVAASAPAPSVTPGPAAQPTGGPVVFTSEMDDTWVKFYDADGTRIFEAQMAKGDTFTIPDDVEDPQIWTGRPYALAITVGGQKVPKLSEEDTVVKDVPVTAEALLARKAAPAAARDTAGTSAPVQPIN